MGFGRFCLLWLGGAFRRSIGLGDLVASIIGNLLTAFAHFYPGYEAAVKDLLWQIPIYGLAGAMLWRLLITPYELWKGAEERALKATQSGPDWPSEIVHRFENDPFGEARDRMARQKDGTIARFQQERQAERARAIANPVPNIGLDDALQWITDRTGEIGYGAMSFLLDLSSVGAISVWGRNAASQNSPLEAIPSDLWRTHTMVWEEDAKSGACLLGSNRIFDDIRFSGLQISHHFRLHPYRRPK